MRTNTDDIDQMIEEALSREEAEYLKELEDETLPNQLLGLYKGKNAWLAYVSLVYIFIFLGIAVYCVYMVFQVETAEEMIPWSLGFFFGFMTVAILKIWNWMQMDKNSMIKHIKHLEYQLAVLASKIKEK